MITLLLDDRDLYEKYAINDCRIVLEYYCKINKFVNNNPITQRGIKTLPLTASGITVLLHLKLLENKSLKENKPKDY
jgi:hypothetical protein